jgi:hypothetical protein
MLNRQLFGGRFQFIWIVNRRFYVKYSEIPQIIGFGYEYSSFILDNQVNI